MDDNELIKRIKTKVMGYADESLLRLCPETGFMHGAGHERIKMVLGE